MSTQTKAFLSVDFHIRRLISDAHKAQYTDINGHTRKPLVFFSRLQWLFVIVAIGFGIYPKIWPSIDLTGYVLTSLSIFVALFPALILSAYDTFKRLDFSEKPRSDVEQVQLIQKKNFIKQYSALVSYAILIAILCILLAGGSLVISLFDRYQTFERSALWFVFVAYRSTYCYFILDFLYLVIYALGAFYSFMKSEYDVPRIKQ